MPRNSRRRRPSFSRRQKRLTRLIRGCHPLIDTHPQWIEELPVVELTSGSHSPSIATSIGDVADSPKMVCQKDHGRDMTESFRLREIFGQFESYPSRPAKYAAE